MKIHVVDAMCGFGKTTAIINKINEDTGNNKFVYITPFLSEVDRIKEACSSKNFKEPNNKQTKMQDIKNLFKNQENIASTHALFKKLDNSILDEIQLSNYTLIMDEVVDVVDVLSISKDDLDTILEKYTKIKPNGTLEWVAKDYEGKFEGYKKMIELNSIVIFKTTDKEPVTLLWMFPIEIFEAFKEIYILTYMFNGQIQKYYYDLYGFEYEQLYIKNMHLTKEKQKYKEKDIKKLIKICDKESLNDIGIDTTSLSSTWFNKQTNSKEIKKLKNNTYNFFSNVAKTKGDQNLWTTFKGYRESLKGKGYTKSFASLNIRATNEYQERKSIAYLSNKYLNPLIKNFFLLKGIKVDENMYALSELIQFIFRGSIRKKEEIYVYIPSKRMRKLLLDWIERE